MEAQVTNCEIRGNCLICNNCFEEKPLISRSVTAANNRTAFGSGLDEDVTDESEQLFSRWGDAFRLFSKLLFRMSDTEGNCDKTRFNCELEEMFEKSRTQGIFRSPCCSSCSTVLFDIVKLQRAIDDNLKAQAERVDQLKNKLRHNIVVHEEPLAIFNDHDDEPYWEVPTIPAKMDSAVAATFLRKSSIELGKVPEGAPRPTRTRRQGRGPPGKRQSKLAKQAEIEIMKTKDYNLEIRPCVVLLERLPDSASYPKVDNKEMTMTPHPSTIRERRSKLKAYEVIRKSCAVTRAPFEKDFDEEGPPSKRIRKSSKLKKESDENEDDEEWKLSEDENDNHLSEVERDDKDNDYDCNSKNCDDASSNFKQQRKRKTDVRKRKKLTNPKYCTRVAKTDLFFLVEEKFLLYKSTIIEVYLRQKMICQEANCTFEADGIDSFAFDKIREHILNFHLPEEDYLTMPRPCPVCKAPFFTTKLKDHLMKRHQPFCTVCEICWKPLKSMMIRAHMFIHKNEEERAAAIALDMEERPGRFQAEPLPELGNVVGHGLPATEDETPTPRKCSKLKEECSGNEDEEWTAPVNNDNFDVEPKHQIKRQRRRLKGPKERKKVLGITERVESRMGKEKEEKKSNIIWWFRFVSEEHLLYKRTLVNVIYSKSLTCDACNFQVDGTNFDSFQEMRQHLDNAHLKYEKLRNCPLCQESCGRDNFKGHFSAHHHLPLNTICEICWKPLGNNYDPRYHTWLHKSMEERELAISAEERDFSNKTTRKYKSLLPRLPCSTCGKLFKTPVQLRGHEVTHLPRDLRPLFQCEYCPEKMLSKRSLQNHIERSHRPDLAVRWRVCRICDRKFYFNDGDRFRSHLRTHSNERPFVCDTCGMSFTRKETMTRHLARVHSTERPYQCEFCEMTYKHPRNLKRHQQAQHKDFLAKKGIDTEKVTKFIRLEHSKEFFGPKIAYPCEICEKVFELRSRLTKHLKERHPVKDEGG